MCGNFSLVNRPNPNPPRGLPASLPVLPHDPEQLHQQDDRKPDSDSSQHQ